MKILLVNKPMQNSKTLPEDLQYVEYYEEYNEIDGIMETKQWIPEWIVETDRFYQPDTKNSNFEFIIWLQKIEQQINRLNKKFNLNIEGIYFYNIDIMVQSLYETIDNTLDAICFYPRYAYIRPRP